MLFIFIPILISILLLLNFLLSPSLPYPEKLSLYECGFTVVYAQTRKPFHLHFWKVALLFLIFDLELVLIFPLALSLSEVGIYGFTIAVIFFLVLTLGFVFEISSGAIKLTNNK